MSARWTVVAIFEPIDVLDGLDVQRVNVDGGTYLEALALLGAAWGSGCGECYRRVVSYVAGVEARDVDSTGSQPWTV